MPDHGLHFLVNARLATLSEDWVTKGNHQGYLLPPLYASSSVRQGLSKLPSSRRKIVVVDNGKFDDLNRLRKEFDSPAESLRLLLQNSGIEVGGDPSRLNVDISARRKVDALFRKLERAARGANGFSVADKISFSPTALIGAENILPALSFSLGLGPKIIANGYQKYAEINRSVIKEAQSRILPSGVSDLPVVAAVDGRSAFDAGQIYARSGIKHIAIPFGAFMADDSFATSLEGATGRVELGGRLPTRVLRSVLVAKGFNDGWRAATQTREKIDHVHLLGLGQPLVLALVALAMPEVSLITVDATSPIKDAISGAIYTSSPSFRKLRAPAVVANLLNQPDGRWTCPCPWCSPANADARWQEARRWAKQNLPHPYSANDLRITKGSPLGAIIPQFRMDANGPILSDRIHHNHWTIITIVDQLNKNFRLKDDLFEFTNSIIDPSNFSSSSSPYYRSLQFAFKLIQGQ